MADEQTDRADALSGEVERLRECIKAALFRLDPPEGSEHLADLREVRRILREGLAGGPADE